MKRTDNEYKNYVSILNEELLPAMGCTEPVAVAYAAAKGREVLGCLPERCTLYVSGNIHKNLKRDDVPNTGGPRAAVRRATAPCILKCSWRGKGTAPVSSSAIFIPTSS